MTTPEQLRVELNKHWDLSRIMKKLVVYTDGTSDWRGIKGNRAELTAEDLMPTEEEFILFLLAKIDIISQEAYNKGQSTEAEYSKEKREQELADIVKKINEIPIVASEIAYAALGDVEINSSIYLNDVLQVITQKK